MIHYQTLCPDHIDLSSTLIESRANDSMPNRRNQAVLNSRVRKPDSFRFVIEGKIRDSGEIGLDCGTLRIPRKGLSATTKTQLVA
jgi:hypothetical protein